MRGEQRHNLRGLSVLANVDPMAGSAARSSPRSYPTMEPEDFREGGDSLHEFLAVLARRKLVVLLAVVLTPLAALAYSALQNPLYAGSAAVLATPGGAGGALNETPGLSASDEPMRFAATQVVLARLSGIAERVIRAAPLFEDPEAFLARSSVSAQADADILRFIVEDPSPDQAIYLATLYAKTFTRYRNELDVQAIRSTRASISRRMAQLAAAGERDTALYTELRQAMRQLDAAETIQGSAAIFVQPAINAAQVQPQTRRNAVLGIVLGLFLGIALALLVERLDTRVQNPDQVEEIVGLPVIGELPSPPDLMEEQRPVSMLEFPHGPYAEGIRKLRANLEFVSLDLGAHVLMVTSAVGGEGKTTTAADLAVALARSGQKVALCDFDSRAPSVDRLFRLGGKPGLVDVAFGITSLDRALVAIRFPTALVGAPSSVDAHDLVRPMQSSSGVERDEVSASHGAVPLEESRAQLDVLTLGRRKPPNPGDFIGSSTVRQIVASLAATHDFVIIDTPPLLPVSDALTVSEYVDAALIVSRLDITRKPMLRSVRKLASVLPTRVLGLVVTGVPETPGYGSYYVAPPGKGASIDDRHAGVA